MLYHINLFFRCVRRQPLRLPGVALRVTLGIPLLILRDISQWILERLPEPFDYLPEEDVK